MSESQSKNETSEKQRRFDPELLKEGLRCDLDQYEMLKRCSDKKDMTKWNEWRKNNCGVDILLEGKCFDGWYLQGVWLNKGNFQIDNGSTYEFKGEVQLSNSTFRHAKCQGAVFHNARLQNTKFANASLEKTIFQGAHLQDANFYKANLRKANFKWVLLNNATSFIEIEIDHYTDFSCTGLGGVRMAPSAKQLLEYNIRRNRWCEWYPKHPVLRWPVRLFWCFSDYGISTWAIIGWFLGLALLFAAIYANCACWWPPGIVSNLDVDPHLPIWHYFLLLLLRPIYFSVVTMTTLGLGDIYANAQSIWGHLLLTFQVIFGYVLLGALVTRFAVLFTAGGPAGKFADEKTIWQRLKELWNKIRKKN